MKSSEYTPVQWVAVIQLRAVFATAIVQKQQEEEEEEDDEEDTKKTKTVAFV